MRDWRRGKGRPELKVVDLATRTPPHNTAAEEAILASILNDGRKLDLVVGILEPEHFYADANRRIYEGAIELQRKGAPIDIQTIAAWLRDREWLENVGGISYIAKVLDSTPAVAHVEAYAKIVRDKHKVRRLIEISQLTAAEGFGDYGDVKEFIDRAEQKIYELAQIGVTGEGVQIYDVIKSTFLQMQEAYDAGHMITGLSTGFPALDQMTAGLFDGSLVIVAARPGMGKTAFVMNVATNVAMATVEQSPGEEIQPEYHNGVMVFSLEMQKDQLASRMMCSEGRVSADAVRKGQLPQEAWDRLVGAANDLSRLALWIDDTPALSVLEMRARIRRKQREFNQKNPDGSWKRRIRLVVIDYLQLVKGSADAETREQQIAGISRDLKQMGKELGVPVIALSQLNRNVEARSTKDKRPQLSDLRESGAIEQDADLILFLYRPEYYESDKRSEKAQKCKGYAEVLVSKQRNGPTGKVPVTFIEEYVRFENRAKDAWVADDDS